ncbi:hypothetical protein Tco_0890508 [Tanacetum coccineum]|uniref:Uncharacterized protein n=1 Tax=Tanacetum coccineum TaxID=301880 RepID=A0ABQ5C0B8_9ASTR
MSITAGCNPTEFVETLQNEFRLKCGVAQSAYEVVKEKDRTIMKSEEMKFFVIGTHDLSEDDAYRINMQKEAI